MRHDSSLAPARPAWVTVDLDALAANLAYLRRCAGAAEVMAVLKADAYGHGAVRLGPFLEAEGVGWFAVALVEEGMALRRAGVEGRILVLSPVYEEQRELADEHELTPMVSSLEQLRMWAAWCGGRGGTLRLHLKLDTGMGRLGLLPKELHEAVRILERAPGLRVEGIASHLAEAEAPGSARNQEQESRYREAVSRLRGVLPGDVLEHVANSAGTIHLPASRHGLVRTGLALYGVDPAGENAQLRGAMTVSCRIAELRELPTGARVGYGGTWTATRASRIGVLPVGYGDGVPWALGNRGQVLVGGRRAQIVGRVSMDLTTVDLTAIAAARGDEAVLLGRQGEASLTAHELAGRAGSMPYEILCRFAARIPRRYVRGGSESVC